MEKYSVSTPKKDGEKTSSKNVCPWCGAEVIRDGEVIRCPAHGSAPFEEKKGAK